MNKIIEWIKSNKVPAALIAVLGFVAFGGFRNNPIPYMGINGTSGIYNAKMSSRSAPQAESFMATDSMPVTGGGYGYGGGAPRLDIRDRMVVTNSYLSLLVKDVRGAMDAVKMQTEKVGGYIVNSSISTPEGLSSGSLTLRVPAKNLDTMLSYLRESAVKVVSENVNGDDITDQYVDTAERLATLQTTKAKYEEILKETKDVEQILLINDRIISVQDQIDSIKGQLEYMNQTSQSTLISVYLSTDELELPFAPENRWDAKLVFKYAVRSLIENARNIAGGIIWIAVYAIFWVPVLVIIWATKKYWKKS